MRGGAPLRVPLSVRGGVPLTVQPWKNACASELEDEAERRIDLPQLVEGQVSDLVSKPAGVDGRGLLHQHASRGAVDHHLRSEAGRSSGRGCGGNQPRGEREVIGLDHDGEATALVLVPPRVSGGTQPIDLTTHASCPCLEGPGRLSSVLFVDRQRRGLSPERGSGPLTSSVDQGCTNCGRDRGAISGQHCEGSGGVVVRPKGDGVSHATTVTHNVRHTLAMTGSSALVDRPSAEGRAARQDIGPSQIAAVRRWLVRRSAGRGHDSASGRGQQRRKLLAPDYPNRIEGSTTSK